MKKGFTLIELLAVIVILGIILVIAVPNIMSIINRTKLDAYKKNEEILISATRTYLTQNGISLQDGESTTISYATLKTSNLIEPIRDINNNNECINSKVYITRNGTNYVYKAGLICDNYISLNTFDLLNGLGKFERDANSDGLADGWNRNPSGANFSLLLGIQNVILTAETSTYGFSIHTTIPINNTHKYYIGCYVKHNNNKNAGLYIDLLKDGIYKIYVGNAYSTSPEFKYVSILINPNSHDVNQLLLMLKTFQSPGDISGFKDVLALNLTEMYGAGNEPTKEAIDALILKSR